MGPKLGPCSILTAYTSSGQSWCSSTSHPRWDHEPKLHKRTSPLRFLGYWQDAKEAIHLDKNVDSPTPVERVFSFQRTEQGNMGGHDGTGDRQVWTWQERSFEKREEGTADEFTRVIVSSTEQHHRSCVGRHREHDRGIISSKTETGIEEDSEFENLKKILLIIINVHITFETVYWPLDMPSANRYCGDPTLRRSIEKKYAVDVVHFF